MPKLKINIFTSISITCLLLSLTVNTQAESFGIYDARGLAMGGTSVAAGKTYQAQYYNPALLALHDIDEDESQDGRFAFPNIVAQIMGPARLVADAVDDDLEAELTSAVNAFNAEQSAVSAAVVGEYSRDLEDLLREMRDEGLLVDGFVGFSVSEPSLHEGGAFYFGVRAISVGTAIIPEEDLALLNQYIDAMDFLAAGGAINDLPAGLVDADGNLIDPSSRLNSSVDLAAIVMGEWAMSMAKQFTFFNQPVSIGITPKLMQVEAFRDSTEFGQDNLSFADSGQVHLAMNFDMGIAVEFLNHYRVGITVKDVVAHDFSTKNDRRIRLRPRSRLGLAFVNDWITIGLDVDITENKPMASEPATQEASLGVEWTPLGRLDLRLGYRHDLMDLREAVLSGGIGYQHKRFNVDIAYAQSENITGASLQMGWAF